MKILIDGLLVVLLIILIDFSVKMSNQVECKKTFGTETIAINANL